MTQPTTIPIDVDVLRRKLESIRDKTKSAQNIPPASWWVGDIAGARRVQDDFKSGQLFWRTAHEAAVSGLQAIDDGDTKKAEQWAWEAIAHYIRALELAIQSKDLADLGIPSGKRGRPKGSKSKKGRTRKTK
jgi:hypothetical protein